MIEPNVAQHHHSQAGVPVVFRCPNGCVHLAWGATTMHFTREEFHRLFVAVSAVAAGDLDELEARRN